MGNHLLSRFVSAALIVLFALAGSVSAADRSFRIAVIYHDAEDAFWPAVETGADRAAKKYGVQVECTAPVKQNVAEQAAMFERAMAAGVDAIALSNIDGQVFNPLIEAALARNIAVVTFGNDAPGSRSMAYYGQDMFKAGGHQGERLMRYMTRGGDILVFTANADAEWSHQREEGFRRETGRHKALRIVGVINTGNDERVIAETMREVIRENPEVAGIATLDNLTTAIAGVVLREMNLAVKVKHVGHDMTPATYSNIKSGATSATLIQNPYRQAYLSVEELVRHLRNGKRLENIDSGSVTVDLQNLDDYLLRLRDEKLVD